MKRKHIYHLFLSTHLYFKSVAALLPLQQPPANYPPPHLELLLVINTARHHDTQTQILERHSASRLRLEVHRQTQRQTDGRRENCLGVKFRCQSVNLSVRSPPPPAPRLKDLNLNLLAAALIALA